MKIFEHPGILPLSRKVHTKIFRQTDSGWKAPSEEDNKPKGEFIPTEEACSGEACVIEEYILRVEINDIPAMQIVCIPEHLPELVLGRLLTEGYIRSADEVEVLDICRMGSLAKVTVRKQVDPVGRMLKGDVSAANADMTDFTGPPNHVPSGKPEEQYSEKTDQWAIETVSTCCTDNKTLQALNEEAVKLQPLPAMFRPWKPEWIWALDERFREDTRLHKETHATHGCFLSLEGEILFEAEDIGRHNAIDKAVGWALINEVPLAECVIYTTGRMPVDMVRKVIRAGIPVMVSKEAPTMEGLRMAQKYGLTLIGNLKNGQMNVYT